MSGSNLSAPVSPAEPDPAPISFSVHSLPEPALADADLTRRTRGRLKMLLVLFVCALPVIASYFTYFVIRPEGRTNYATLIDPPRPVPPGLAFEDLQGAPSDLALLRGNWTLVVVGGGACDERCEKHLWLVRQLRETLGRDRDRVDKLWLIDDAVLPKAELVASLSTGAPTRIWRAPRERIASWLDAAPGQSLDAHLYVVDPFGHWMMRSPVETDPGRFKRDVERLLRASASWQTPALR
jgi:hypothetical protein